MTTDEQKEHEQTSTTVPRSNEDDEGGRAIEVIVRGDSGFAREGLMSWCESHQVDYVLGLARNSRGEMENRIKEQQLDLFACGRFGRR